MSPAVRPTIANSVFNVDRLSVLQKLPLNFNMMLAGSRYKRTLTTFMSYLVVGVGVGLFV